MALLIVAFTSDHSLQLFLCVSLLPKIVNNKTMWYMKNFYYSPLIKQSIHIGLNWSKKVSSDANEMSFCPGEREFCNME